MAKTKTPDIVSRYIGSKPLGIVILSEDEASQIRESRHGFDRFSIVRSHAELSDLKKGNVCLVYIRSEDGKTSAQLMGIKSKGAVATPSSRINLVHASTLTKCSPAAILPKIPNKRLAATFEDICSQPEYTGAFSKRLGQYVFTAIAGNNRAVIASLLEKMDGHTTRPLGWKLQASILYDVLATFGVDKNEEPDEVFAVDDDSSAVELLNGPAYLLEDQVIAHDTRDIPGWDLIESDMTGMAVFTKGVSRLTVFTANRGPIEKATGADLVYINNEQKNAVLVQYKMLEQEERNRDGEEREWVYRPDKQFNAEVERMKKFKLKPAKGTDYRLNYNPFYFKFVKRIEHDLRNAGLIVSLDHLTSVLDSKISRGKKGGLRINYKVLDGRYLRKGDLVGLIRSGYIGTTESDSKAILELIRRSLDASLRTSLIAYQDTVSYDDDFDEDDLTERA
jgi:hypothetical protein